MTEDLADDEEERWCAEQRENVRAFLAHQGLQSPAIGDWPAWHVAPIVSIWAIESQTRPGWVGWWAVSGDFPTDYTACGAERHPRQGLRDIGNRWRQASAEWLAGKRIVDWSLGSPEQERDLAPLLATRAQQFLDMAKDDTLWTD